MTNWNRVSGDVKDTIVVGLNGVPDITGCLVEGHVWRVVSEAKVSPTDLVGAPTILIASPGILCTVTIQLGVGGGGANDWLPIAVADIWFFEQELLFTDGQRLTWPARGSGLRSNDTITVRSQGEA